MRKKGWIWVVALIGLLVVTACGKEKSANNQLTDWEKIKEKGEIVVGVDDSFVPMGFRDENDQLVGFDIDLATAVFDEAGVKVKFQPIEWSMKETELNNGTIDVIWNGYTITPERKEKVAFSNTYLKNEQVLVSLKKYDVSSYGDMKGQVLGAQEGSSGADALETKPEILLDIVKDGEPVLYGSFVEAFLDLNSGRIHGLVIDSVFAEYYISKEKNASDYIEIPSEFEEEDYAIGVRKEDKETLKQINDALKKLYQEGKTSEISQKWFGEDKVVPQK